MRLSKIGTEIEPLDPATCFDHIDERVKGLYQSIVESARKQPLMQMQLQESVFCNEYLLEERTSFIKGDCEELI